MTKPNFFIVGAPKCGTTALSEYLRSHPNIFISTPKELHYFSEELTDDFREAKTLDQYLNFFKDCKKEQLAIGESSPAYLFSPVALNNIRKFDKNSKIIVMLRNPVDLAYSLHSQLVFNFSENEKDFEKAWKLQDSRRKGHNIYKKCTTPSLLQYSKVCMLGDQVEKLLKKFPAEQVKLILFDDFKASTKMVYEDVLSFLEVPSDGKSSFPRINQNKEIKGWLRGFLNYDLIRKSEPLNSIVNHMKDLFGVKRLGVRAIIRGIIAKGITVKKRPPMSPDFRAELIDEFREDIKKLSMILDRDLSHWYK
jgi:hypothetical protein